ncbi:MAG: hypothetical protein IPM60_00125 [Rhodospirillales bacterium]|nr:hypothetical protein [Rhodospirillales bacterium]
MLGLSLSKVLFTALVILAVWYGYRWWTRVESRRRADLEARMRDEIGRSRGGATRRPAGRGADELVRCAVCGTYVAASVPTRCDRADCPHRR